MTKDLSLPDRDAPDYEEAVRSLRDHLLGAADVDRQIMLNGQPYVIAWADRRVTKAARTAFTVTSGMRVLEGDAYAPPEVVSSGEEQITIVIDGERLVFHLVEASDDEDRMRRLRPGAFET